MTNNAERHALAFQDKFIPTPLSERMCVNGHGMMKYSDHSLRRTAHISDRLRVYRCPVCGFVRQLRKGG